MAEQLDTTGPTKPGIYIGKIYRNQTSPPAGYRRYPMVVGKGNRLFTQYNVKRTRSYVTAAQITFAAVSPHTATLAYAAIPDQTLARLYKANGTTVAASKWVFAESISGSGVYDTILLRPEVFDAAATYYIDYQSNDRTILDPIPFDDLRLMRDVGDVENQAKYIEGVHYAVPVDITTPAAATANGNSLTTDHAITSVVATVGNVGTAVVTINGAQLPLNHNYNRAYTLRVTNVVGPSVTVHLEAAQNSGGIDSAAPVPVHPSLPSGLFPAGMVGTATTGALTTLSFTDPEIGETIDVDWDLTTYTSTIGDTYTFSTLGHSFIEVDSGLQNTNQWPEVSAVTAGLSNTGTGSVSIRVDSNYSGLYNRTYRLVCTTVSGTSPNRQATFLWAGWGEMPVTTGTFTINEPTATNTLVAFDSGIRLALAFGGTNFATGDTFEFTAKTARKYISAKDNRNYTFTVSTATAGAVAGSYLTDTPEGRAGLVSVTGPVGQLRLPGNVDLWFRNVGSTTGQNRYVAGDVWTWVTTNENVIDWSLTARQTETIPVSKVYTDTLGTATGTPGAPFVILSALPTSLIYVRDSVTGSIITGATLVTNKPMVQLTAIPSNPIEIRYEYIGAEPAPGANYYITADTLRPLADFNRPIFLQDYDNVAAPFLGPSATDNDLLIAAHLMLKDNGAPGIYVVQVRDSDGDGVYTTYDYTTAIQQALAVTKNTDLIVLGKADTLSAQMSINEEGNNPFRDHVNLALWVGMPTGSIIGDVDTEGSVVYTAKRTLQLPQQSQARGTRCLPANWEAVKTIQLTDGSQVDVTLDGSFVAAAVAAKNASFEDPNTLLLDQIIAGFKSMKTFNEDEILNLIAASAMYLYNDGTDDAPVFKCGEGVTVDTSSDDLHEVNVAINVRAFTQADMREHLRSTVIGFVPESTEIGVAAYRTQIVLRLNDWRTRGIIGAYEDADGNERTLDPNTDVVVYRSKTRKTQYYFKYAWFGKYGSTRGFGLYAVDVSNVSQPV